MINGHKRHSRLLFAREFLKHPIRLGSVVPSSRFLVDRLLRQVDWPATRVLVEYGPGVGTFTAEILRRLRPDATLVAIEASREFVGELRHSYPDRRLAVVHNSAAEVRCVLDELQLDAADVIVSGIPFSTLRHQERERILSESKLALRPGGRFLAYQFSGKLRADLERIFGDVERDLEPLNILPARIFSALNSLNPA
jgi:phospholipid N-methyltransferase